MEYILSDTEADRKTQLNENCLTTMDGTINIVKMLIPSRIIIDSMLLQL